MIKELGTLKEATISILAEDTIAFDTPFWGRFGLSMLLELSSDTSEKQILYDTNTAAAPILHNLNILGKSLGEVSAIFLSHCHYDHTDGLAGILDALGHPISVVAHPEIFRPCFEINPDGIRHIGIVGQSRGELEQKGAVFTLTKQPLNLMTGVTTTGEIERLTAFEELEDLYTIINGDVVQDHERDDMSVILNFPEGLVIVTGCCHAGIVNTMEHTKKLAVWIKSTRLLVDFTLPMRVRRRLRNQLKPCVKWIGFLRGIVRDLMVSEGWQMCWESVWPFSTPAR